MRYLIVLLAIFFSACSNEDDVIVSTPDESNLYFPPMDSDTWATRSIDELSWSISGYDELVSFLEENGTRAFIILKDGRIVVEEYFGNNVLGTAPFTRNSQWYWASVGKALSAVLVGLAQQDNLLDIDDSTSDYLGEGWTSLAPDQEELIKVSNQLTMTTGLDYEIPDLDCTLPSCLTYRADAGQEWYYHNGPYTLLKNVIEQVSGIDYNAFTDQKIEDKIGMSGQWISQAYNYIYWSTARDMARFGLLMLNKGSWENDEILSDMEFYNQMLNTSQSLNQSYGYLWWLNGKNSIIYPGIANTFNVQLSENAPQDMVAGLGKNGQFLQLIPSQNLIIVRMGEAPDNSLAGISFNNDMWEKINLLINN
jgi:CubicO group peptidase (beta-lactamase class C family)